MNTRRISILALAFIMVFTLCVSNLAPFSTATDDDSDGIALVTLQSTWKYLDDGTDPGSSSDRTSWTAVDFDDSAWKTGSGDATFGAKAGKLQALDAAGIYLPKILLTHYMSNGLCVPTYFFRTTFDLDSAPASGLALMGSVFYDDAAIIYVNGTRVAAFDEPDGGFETNLTYGGSGAYDPKLGEFTADASLLKAGKNVISVEVHNQRSDSSDVYFEMSKLSLGVGTPEYLTMNVGEDETKRNFTWYFASSEGAVQFAERNGDTFPETYTTVKSTATEHNGTYIHRATISGLKPDTEYVYRVLCGNIVSKHYNFKTDPSDSFNFIFVGDPQIGASWGGSDDDDISGWTNTLDKASSMFPNTSLLVSAGDQVETYNNEAHYSGFLAPEALSSLAIATTVGNHDALGSLYSEHFNNPNTTINGIPYGVTAAGGDYWYTYNNTLFMHINHNNHSVAEHKAFMQYAIAQNPDVTWKVVVVHFAYFGAHIEYYNHELISGMRAAITPIYDELGIDVVLSGHEHSYARSYMVTYDDTGCTIHNENKDITGVTDPEGIFYITGASSSGSKYYDILADADSAHVAVKLSHTTTFSNVEIDSDSFKITTYRSEDGSVVDTFEIIKDKELVPEIPSPSDEVRNIALFKDYEIASPDKWNANLTDGIAVDSMTWVKTDWYGYQYGANSDGEENITFDLGAPEKVQTIRMHILDGGTEHNSSIRPADKFEVFVSDDGVNYRSVGEMPVVQPDSEDFNIYWTELKLDAPIDTRYVQIRISQSGGFVMLNEIKIYNGVPNLSEDETKIDNDPTLDIIDDNIAKGKKYETSLPYRSGGREVNWGYDENAEISYPDTNKSELTNGIIATDADYDNNAWVGLHSETPDAKDLGYAYAKVNLEDVYDISKIEVYFPDADFNTSAGVTGPKSTNVTFYADGVKIDAATKITAYNDNIAIYSVDTAVEAKEIEIRVVHGGWIFMSEISVNGVICNHEQDNDPVIPPEGDDPITPPQGGSNDDEESEFMPGDINANEKIDMTDYILLKRAYFGTFKFTETQNIAGDINKNNRIDMTDYILLKRVYFGTYTIK